MGACCTSNAGQAIPPQKAAKQQPAEPIGEAKDGPPDRRSKGWASAAEAGEKHQGQHANEDAPLAPVGSENNAAVRLHIESAQRKGALADILDRAEAKFAEEDEVEAGVGNDGLASPRDNGRVPLPASTSRESLPKDKSRSGLPSSASRDQDEISEASKLNQAAIVPHDGRSPKKVVISRRAADHSRRLMDSKEDLGSVAQQAPLVAPKKQDSKRQLQESDLLIKHYEVGRKLGEGTFGVVHECVQRGDDTKTAHAVKYIDKVAQDKDVILLETSMMRTLDHPNIVKCLDVFDEPAFMCIVMEKWDGRDVVSRLIEHTENDEDLKEDIVSHLVRQMLASLVYLHANGMIHRDVKMDNYLIDKPRLDDPTSRVALADFGCATYLKLGDRMDESVGTKVYKSPEFIMEDYCHKVDVWAVGVSMYGLLNGSLPFADEASVLQSRPLMPKGVSPPCLCFLKLLLMKNEARRPHAAEAMKDAFLAVASDQAVDHRKSDTSTTGKKPSLKLAGRNEAVDESIVERRETLMARLNMSMKKVGSLIPVSAKSFRASSIRYGAVDSRHFAWWSFEKAQRELLANLRSRGNQAARVQPHLMDVAWTPQVIAELFQRHKVEPSQYGKGNAKTIEEVADEMKRGATMLMLDGTKHSKLVRVVDLVVLQVELDISGLADSSKKSLGQKGVDQLLLTCASSLSSSGWELPHVFRRPHETLLHAVARLQEAWRLAGCEVDLRYDSADCSEEMEKDEQYPMVPTMHRRYVIPGTVRITSPETSKELGLGEDMSLQWEGGGCTFGWATSEECKARNISLLLELDADGSTKDTFSGLVRVPISFSEEMVSSVFRDYGVDSSKFGVNGASTLADIAEEVSRGESCLYEIDGKLKRVTTIVLMQIEDTATGRILMEVEKTVGDGAAKETNRLPGLKLRPQEEITDGVGRLVSQRLNFDLHSVHLVKEAADMVEEEDDSLGYPGLNTLYRKFIVKAKVTTTSGQNAAPAPGTEATVCPPSDERLEMSDRDSPREAGQDELAPLVAVEPLNADPKKKKIAKKKKKDPESAQRALKDGDSKDAKKNKDPESVQRGLKDGESKDAKKNKDRKKKEDVL